MLNNRTTLKYALDWLDANAPRDVYDPVAIALDILDIEVQAEQEPVEKEIAAAVLDHCYGYSAVNDDMIERTSVVVKKILDKHDAPHPVQQIDLTDSEIAELWVEGSTLIEFARAAIATDREKNNV